MSRKPHIVGRAALPGRRVPVARRLAFADRGRFLTTAAASGFAVALMLLLSGIYRGARSGAVSFVERQPVDVWVARDGTGNLLRSNTVFAATTLDAVSFWPGVDSASPLLRVLVRCTAGRQTSTLFLFGVDSRAQAGFPGVESGTARPGPGEVVIDQAFALRRGIGLGDSVQVGRRSLQVVGISRDTNALVAQYAFADMDEVRALVATGAVVSFGLLTLEPGIEPDTVLAELRLAFPHLEFVPHDRFVDQNVREMETGVLPVLWAIAAIGALSSLALITLLLHSTAEIHRTDYALLAAVGAEPCCLARIVLGQSLLVASGGTVMGLLFLAAIRPAAGYFVPELDIRVSAGSVVAAAAFAALASLAAAVYPLHRVRSLWPGEVFRA